MHLADTGKRRLSLQLRTPPDESPASGIGTSESVHSSGSETGSLSIPSRNILMLSLDAGRGQIRRYLSSRKNLKQPTLGMTVL